LSPASTSTSASTSWGRVRKADGTDDVANVRTLEKTGWRPVPADKLPRAQHFTRQNTMHGGIAVAARSPPTSGSTVFVQWDATAMLLNCGDSYFNRSFTWANCMR
jgi:hypothetical protein